MGIMNRRRCVWLASLVGALATSAVAQAPAPASFETRLAQATTSLMVGPGGFSGQGAPVLADAIKASRYVLIGESHLTREIPAFTTQVCRLMAPSGLTAMVIETGPEAGRVVDAAMRAEDPTARIDSFLRAHPDGVAFYGSRDEVRTAAGCAAAAGPDFALWGLDQEFLGSSGHLLAEMLAANPGPKSRAALSELAEQDRAATAAAVASGSPGDLFLIKVSPEVLERAGEAVAADGGDRVRYLFGLLTESHAIYSASQAKKGDPNGRRARLMKRTLAAHLADHPDARLLMKFGAYHLYKSVNPLDQRDVGAWVAERADGEGVNALHIVVTGATGAYAAYAGVGRAASVRTFDVMKDKDPDWTKDLIVARPAGTPPEAWTLVDLRALRTQGLAGAPEYWRELALGYDLAILAPTVSAADMLGKGGEAKR